MTEYKPNSHRSKQGQNDTPPPEKKVEKVVTGPVKARKRSGLRKLADIFVPDDVENVKSYIVQDIVIPAVQDILLDSLGAFLGRSIHSARKNNGGSKVSYRSYYDRAQDRGPVAVRSGYSYNDIILNSRGEAESVLTRMDEIVSTYGVVSVYDYYELVGADGTYADNKYGWTDIRSADIARTRDGYIIRLPKALPID